MKIRLRKKFKKVFKLFFSRIAITVLLLLLQVAFLVVAYIFLSKNFAYFYALNLIFSVLVLVYIMNSKGNASFKIAWIIPVLVIPLFGSLLYLFYRNQSTIRYIKKRLTAIDANIERHLAQNTDDEIVRCRRDSGENGLARYLYNAGHYPVYTNTAVKYFSSGEQWFPTLLEELEKAEKFIFLEFFIIADGMMWNTILDILKRKAAQGVEVRVMYDGTCSFVLLPYKYPKMLRKEGIQCQMFAPVTPILSTYQNNRDHRKILVIDGKVAFTGGCNLADEYINHIVRFGYWKDTAIMLKGDAVKSMTMMFFELWNVGTITDEECNAYIAADASQENAEGIVIPYGDGPYNDEDTGQQVYIDILNRASDYVHIMTPYLILDDEMIGALGFAAKRGVDVTIIMPHIPDKKYPYLLARTYYRELLLQGVKIYEFTPGFLHAKQFVSDDIRAVVGSFNLDYRSLYLHYECAAYMYDVPEIAAIEADFQETLAKSQQITIETCDGYPKISNIIGGFMRLFAPFM